MNRAARSLCALGAATSALLAPGTAAVAGTAVQASPPLLQSNWYFHRMVSDAPVAGLPDAEPSNVPVGDLPVASRDGNGTPSKLSIIAFDLPKSATGGSVSTFDVSMTVDSNATNVIPSDLKLSAELALRNWSNGKGGEQDTVNAPPADAASAVPGTMSSDGKTVVFHVAGIAQDWLDDANFGLELLPAKGYATPFQISFLGGKAVRASASFTPGSAPVAAAPPAGSSTTGTGASAPTSLSGTPSLGLPPGGPTVNVPTALTAPVAAPAAGASVPQVAAPTAATAAAIRPLQRISAAPTAGVLAVGVAALALLVLLSLTLGGEPPAAAARRSSRLTSVLQSRSRDAASGTPGIAVV